ncbi:MAG: ACT domain-containing protein [Anaerolineae bacterium]
MPQTVEQALSQAQFYSDGVAYAFIQLPATAITAAAGVLAEIGQPFAALIVDKDEVSLVIAKDQFEEYARRMPGHAQNAVVYRLITIDVVLEPDLVGFMAFVSAALAKAGITLMPFAAFSRDHLLVPSDKFDAAMQVLETLRT